MLLPLWQYEVATVVPIPIADSADADSTAWRR